MVFMMKSVLLIMNIHKSKGYEAENPWADFANASVEGDEIASGWIFRNADKPANIRAGRQREPHGGTGQDAGISG